MLPNVLAKWHAAYVGAFAWSKGLGCVITLSPWGVRRLYRIGDVELAHHQLIDLKSSDSCAANYEPTNGNHADCESANR